MTLEDFFTLTELKNGLTTPARVNELLTVIHKEKNSVTNNVGEITRQWSAVASTIAATENKECLDLFLQLDGLGFIDKWLNDAQKFENGTGNVFLEELITALLRALERLQVDNQRAVASGIEKTVEGLISHSSSVVQEKAKALIDRWAPVQDVEKIEAFGDKENMEQPRDQKTLRETVMESVVDSSSISVGVGENLTVDVESDRSKSEITALTGGSQLDNKHVVDANEKQEIDAGAVELEALPASTDVDIASESATKTEMREETSVKDDTMDGEDSPDMEFKTSHMSDSSAEAENPKTTSDTESDDEGGEDEKKDVGIESDDDSRFPKRSMNGQDGDLVSKRPSDMELDYGIVDPLELARQVANEVEREVDSQEQSCSTSHNSEIERPNKNLSSKEVSSSCQPEIPPTEISEKVLESEPNAEKGFSGIDLNQEVSSEETDCLVDPISTTISVVSASRAAAADGLPVAPLQFEGTLGWKGSAATSAFRRIPEVEKSNQRSDQNQNQNQNRLDFDLNVAEDSEDKIEDLLPRDKMPIASLLPSDEANPRNIAKLHLELDLNSLGECDSGSISLRNIDLNLNDHSNIPNNAFLDTPFQEEPVFSIFGTQVEMKRKDSVSVSVPPATVDFSLGRPGTAYANLPVYGHNGFPLGPAMSFTSPMYGPPGGPIPYMVDSRGAPIVPQITPSFPQQTQPFIFNMAANSAGPSRHNLDLNSGFTMDGGNRERQFFNQSQIRPVDEQYLRMGNSLQASSSSSVIGGKRHEPDSGWDPFPVTYKHHQPPPWQ